MAARTLRGVIGFIFDGKGNVLLIRKNSPEWQKGRLNGLGGKIERGESPLQTMIREFREEAGVTVEDWREFCKMSREGYRLYLFTSRKKVKINPNDEEGEIGWYPVNNLPENTLPNMRFLIPMADYKLDISAKIIHPSPVC